jgi:virulence factor Mce-like protein
VARSERRQRIRRRLQGLAFLAVVAGLLSLTVLIYNKALPWQASDPVTLIASRIGNQLVVPADVKLDGIVVGRVSGVSANGTQARLSLQISPSRMSEIPANVEARILPKTIFGEKYVDLVIPASGPSTDTFATLRARHQPIVIGQDRSATAIELQKVFNDLVPVLQSFKPAELSIALSNIADALQNRGDALGHNLQLVEQYFSRFNTDLPNLAHDISALADTASTYADAAPDLLAMLRDFSVNAHTFTVKQDVFAQFLAGTRGFAQTASQVFGDNANRLITLAHVSQPVLDVYAKYSVVLECLPNGLAIYDRTRLEQAFGDTAGAPNGPYLHITLTPVGDRGPYSYADRPLKSDLTDLSLPPNCYGLPYGSNGLHPVNSAFPGPHPSGNYGCAGTTAPPTCPTAPPTPAAPLSATAGPASNIVGSAAEQSLVSTVFAPMLGGDSDPGLTDLLLAPMLRGMAVSVS